MRRTQLAAALATIVVLTCAGCSGDRSPSAGSTTSPTASTSSSSNPTPVPAYLESFSKTERRAYAAAVHDYKRFSDRHAQIMAAGKATPQAKRFYRRYTADWQTYWATLRQREANGVRVLGKGETLRTRPSRIRVHGDGTGSVGLNVCGVSSGVKVLQKGTPVPQPKPTPRIVRVGMVQLEGDMRWRVLYERVGPKC